MKNTFDILLLFARSAAGKSEAIHYLKPTSLEERAKRFHTGAFEEIDDFPMLWTWFEEDEMLERMGHPRLHSDANAYFLSPYLWDVLIERIDMEYRKNCGMIPLITKNSLHWLSFNAARSMAAMPAPFGT